MSAYSNQVKHYIERYKAETGNNGLLDPHKVAAWALSNGLHKPNPKTIIDAVAADISQAFREEYRTDPHGRRYRAKHAATHKNDNKTMSLWADLDDPVVPHSHFVRSFAQRRQQIVGDCLQLKTDVDVYNHKRDPDQPIQIPLDFTLDVAELQQLPHKVA
ncbi:hypothetical protein HKJ32_06030 [Xylella fastidiosa subsp. multiplex]|uniref:hypothetical protein n=1 Tax=Xylella fastidiosa TaxID=2371 RepID=UPI00146355FC|nr:hypothetical protein [Xylella fastidiosa]QJP56008.1 hypothetical protein HKJ32_06030 [Xylella fastidiosa subsp. multiplex]